MEYRCLHSERLLSGKRLISASLYLAQRVAGKQIFLKFDAASKATAVYVNGEKVGEHAGGYTAFSFDVTSYLKGNETNLIAVCIDNNRTDITPISADFTFFGGIYRDVWLTAVSRQHFDMENLVSEGVFVSTPEVSEEKSIEALRGKIKNETDRKVTLELQHILYLPDGRLAQSWKSAVELHPISAEVHIGT